MFWQTSRFRLELSRPLVMGIVNVTPDSFSDGGRYAQRDAALAHARSLLEEGADILDVGGESTRPGARTPSLQEELDRVMPVLEALTSWGVPISVDTSQPELMRQALGLGVDIINDVRSLQRPGALDVVAAHPSAGVCLMHMQGEPGRMQDAPHYADVVGDVRAFLAQRLEAVQQAGVNPARIVLDPGYGFGKTTPHNLALLRGQAALCTLGQPLLVGWSRKRSLGELTGRAVDQRVVASVAAALASVDQGARILRVHDVAATVDGLKVWQALGRCDPSSSHSTASCPMPGSNSQKQE